MPMARNPSRLLAAPVRTPRGAAGNAAGVFLVPAGKRDENYGSERYARPDAGRAGVRVFGLTTGTPVIVVGRTAYSTSRPIRMTRYVYRADRVRLAHEVATIPEKYQDARG